LAPGEKLYIASQAENETESMNIEISAKRKTAQELLEGLKKII
jgi:hypothetical protein